MTARVMFYVQHLLGIGHVKRAAAITRAMGDAGVDVSVVLGGKPIDVADFGDARTIQLPPIEAADETFSRLVDDSGETVGPALEAERRDRLLAAFADLRPDVLMCEQFPFGRRMLGFELMPLIEAANAATPRPAVIGSVRDILVEKARPERYRRMAELVRRYFDLVLVHGDPSLIAFDATFPEADVIRDRLRYTGYVVDAGERVADSDAGTGEMIVSVGGGATGEPVIRAALAARPATAAADRLWRVLCGPRLKDPAFERLRAEFAGPDTVIERIRRDFPVLLRNCHLSVSQGGYNTTMDVLRAGARAVIVPFAGQDQTEQRARAKLLHDRGLLRMVEPDGMSPESVAEAISGALAAPVPGRQSIDFSGARTTAGIVADIGGSR